MYTRDENTLYAYSQQVKCSRKVPLVVPSKRWYFSKCLHYADQDNPPLPRAGITSPPTHPQSPESGFSVHASSTCYKTKSNIICEKKCTFSELKSICNIPYNLKSINAVLNF